MTTPIIDKITALLAKAERTTNEAEAEAYFEKAQALSTKYSIDMEQARANGGSQESTLGHKMFTMGIKRQFGLYSYVALFAAVANANDVRCTVTSDSTKVYAYGYSTDIEIVETLFNSLMIQMSQAAVTYIAKGEYKNEKIWREGYWENYGGARGREWVPAGYKQVHGSTARLSFQAAFADRVGMRLWIARQSSIRAETASTGSGAELVLASKAKTVETFFSRFAGKGTYKGGQGAAESAMARRAGREAGDKARLGNTPVGGQRKGVTS